MAMDLDVTQVAQAVGKPVTYVRQHIHRHHLPTTKKGRRVFVSLEDAMTWATERGLPFELPESWRRPLLDVSASRFGRLSILAQVTPDGAATNVFTSVRHRSSRDMGPWASSSDSGWQRQEPGETLVLLTRDASLPVCEALVAEILEEGRLHVDGLDLVYELEQEPRRHWLYRDDVPLSSRSLRSPFSRHSAEVTEYRCFNEAQRRAWIGWVDAHHQTRPDLEALGFPILQRTDRVGGLVIAGAHDEISCRVRAMHDDRLLFEVTADAEVLAAGNYRVTVWASHSGDEVLREHAPLSDKQLVFPLRSLIDRLGFEVFRGSDGRCVDRMEGVLIMETGLSMEVRGGPDLIFTDRRGGLFHRIPAQAERSISNVGVEDGAALDIHIRRRWLAHQTQIRERVAHESGALVRFGPDDFQAAVKHTVNLLSAVVHDGQPVYLTDPYLFAEVEGDVGVKVRAYLDLFAAVRGIPLRILCSRASSNPPQWWAEIAKLPGLDIEARAFFRYFDPNDSKKNKTALHDRVLITPTHELLMTNSINGWAMNGVTFIKTVQGVYRAEAEQLWALPLGWAAPDRYVQEIQL